MSGTHARARGLTLRVDMALTMLDDMQKRLDTLTRAVHAMAESMVVIEDAHKLTDAHPFASGRHDAEITHYANEGWSDRGIAEELGTSAATVSRRRAALGICAAGDAPRIMVRAARFPILSSRAVQQAAGFSSFLPQRGRPSGRPFPFVEAMPWLRRGRSAGDAAGGCRPERGAGARAATGAASRGGPRTATPRGRGRGRPCSGGRAAGARRAAPSSP